jgi:hypothetical protein
MIDIDPPRPFRYPKYIMATNRLAIGLVLTALAAVALLWAQEAYAEQLVSALLPVEQWRVDFFRPDELKSIVAADQARLLGIFHVLEGLMAFAFGLWFMALYGSVSRNLLLAFMATGALSGAGAIPAAAWTVALTIDAPSGTTLSTSLWLGFIGTIFLHFGLARLGSVKRKAFERAEYLKECTKLGYREAARANLRALGEKC